MKHKTALNIEENKMDKNTLRNYGNTVQLNFSERGDNFSLNVPHYKKWLNTIAFLRRRGFKVGENEYHKRDGGILSKYHKIGFKKDVVCLMEIRAGAIDIEFGSIKNLWKDMTSSFWSNKGDERYTQLTYMEDKEVELEIVKLMDYFKRFNHELIVEDKNLSPEDFIINKLYSNTHIHGKVKVLADIKKSIEVDKNSYNYLHNSNDMNKKKILCGEVKYFYDYRTKRLSYGTVWHNINNMWWVISGGELRNISAFNLFDFNESLSRKEIIDERKINQLLDRYEKNKDYMRCFNIKRYAENNLKIAV